MTHLKGIGVAPKKEMGSNRTSYLVSQKHEISTWCSHVTPRDISTAHSDLSQLSSWSFLCCVAATASCLSASVWHLTAPAPAATRSVVCFPCSLHRPPLARLVTPPVTPPWEWTSTISLCGASAHVHVSAWLLSLGRSLSSRVLWHLIVGYSIIWKSTQLSLTLFCHQIKMLTKYLWRNKGSGFRILRELKIVRSISANFFPLKPIMSENTWPKYICIQLTEDAAHNHETVWHFVIIIIFVLIIVIITTVRAAPRHGKKLFLRSAQPQLQTNLFILSYNIFLAKNIFYWKVPDK